MNPTLGDDALETCGPLIMIINPSLHPRLPTLHHSQNNKKLYATDPSLSSPLLPKPYFVASYRCIHPVAATLDIILWMKLCCTVIHNNRPTCTVILFEKRQRSIFSPPKSWTITGTTLSLFTSN